MKGIAIIPMEDTSASKKLKSKKVKNVRFLRIFGEIKVSFIYSSSMMREASIFLQSAL
jgi:hypothetical protein